MWVSKSLFDRVLDDNRRQQVVNDEARKLIGALQESVRLHSEQKVRDDLNLDWMRHRVNALEKQNTQLMSKATGLVFSAPELVAQRPGMMTDLSDLITSFEDIGDDMAKKLGIDHDDSGFLAAAEG